MWQILYLAICIALQPFGITASVYFGSYVNNTDPHVLGGGAHECFRDCVEGDNRVCVYDWAQVEWITMGAQCGDCPEVQEDCFNRGCITAGGDPRFIHVVNYMLPGPSVQVCLGDTVQVRFKNGLRSDTGTIHWHGMYQKDSPWMDGVPYVTQCPILPGNTFVYNFTAEPAGTQIWHSHVGLLDADGVFGSVIVREPDDPHIDLYDYDLAEHNALIWHWWDNPTENVITSEFLEEAAPTAYSLIINGLGATLEYSDTNGDSFTPRANFTVTQGYRYRFRFIDNSVIYCPVQVSVDSHNLTMITSDGVPFEAVEAESFIINAGERYDFVLNANQDIKNYWIRFRGLGGFCADSVYSTAILRYDGADEADPLETNTYNDGNRGGVLLSPVDQYAVDYPDNTVIKVSELNCVVPTDESIQGTPDETLYITIALKAYANFLPNGPYGQLDSISYVTPSSPLLTQPTNLSTTEYCIGNNTNSANCVNGYCSCPHIYEVEKDSLVEIFFLTPGGGDDHPIHMHGYSFYVVASGYEVNTTISEDSVRALNEAGLIERNLETAPRKDVIPVPANGYIALRMFTSNPGYWLFHCHIGGHFDTGMGAILKVGEDSDMVPPPVGFPTCGSYDITQFSEDDLTRTSCVVSKKKHHGYCAEDKDDDDEVTED